MAELGLSRLTKHFGETTAVDALDLEVKDREFMTLLGPSGSGKTTVLRMIAGYIEPTAGKVRDGSREVQDRNKPRWPFARRRLSSGRRWMPRR